MIETLAHKASRVDYRLKQLRALQHEFGAANALHGLYGKIFDETNAPTLTVTNPLLDHPLSLRRTYSDMWGFIEVCRNKDYAIPDQLMNSVHKKPIVDLGAYIGNTAAYFASTYRHSPVVAIEPLMDNYELLKANASAYAGQIATHKAAVSPNKGKVRRVPFGANTHDKMLSGFLPAADGNEVVDVDTFTPQDVVNVVDGQDIGILKVDIEGAERYFFDSPTIGELLQKTGILLIETHDQWVAGCSDTVHVASTEAGMQLSPLGSRTTMYVASALQ
ncbi:MAG TPA: FkbM family methyltransferase [Candidatus Saccharimonadales bacterium]|nr:FkbM family methyltransferase [Candidatus Saccharimonadales bacterium]